MKVAAVERRELKALEIAARCRIEYKDGAWRVPSQTTPSTVYRVTLSPVSCQCDDWQLRAQPCKHVIAARLVQERDHGGQPPKIDADEVPKKPTYKQDWRAYTLAQTTEKHRLQALLSELCRGVEEPPYKGGRTPTPIAAVLFTCAYKVYSTFSGRRFACDLRDAHERGYVSHAIPPTKIASHMDRADLTPILKALIVRASLPLRAVEVDFAPDSSGFSTSRFVRWYDEKYGVHRSGHDWVKVHIMTGVKTNIVTAIEILDKNAADCPVFRPLVEKTAENFKIQEVSADKAYLSHDNLELVAGLGAMAFVPFKVNSVDGGEGVWSRMYHYFQFRREEFLKHYHKRSNVESTFSMVKAKFRDHVRSRSDTAMVNEVLCKFLCHNICCVIQAQCELGIEAELWKNEPAGDGARPNVLLLVRPG
jgi:transposase